MKAPGLSARLAFLLPCMGDATHAPMAEQLEAHVRLLATASWVALVQECASLLPPGVLETLDPPGPRMPDPDLLLARLGPVVNPALLLGLPLADRDAVTSALLAHPDAQIREQTLDALADRTVSECSPLHDVCIAWSRRMLMAELGRIPTLSHTDRLCLQEQLLAGGSDPKPAGSEVRAPETQAPEMPGTQILGDALRTAANRMATVILAERAGVTRAVAEVAIALRDPKMLTALCWKAGCDPAETLAVQLQLGHVSPGHVLHAGPGGQWPLDGPAMQRQIDILEAL